MSNVTLKSTVVAATVALSFLAAPAACAEATPVSRDTGVGLTIAAQGNAALRLIQTEFKAAAQKVFKPAKVQARKKRVDAPAAAAGGSIAATAACAE